MALITPPGTLPVRQDSWRIITPAQVNLSKWSGGRRVQLLPGARFACELDFRPLLDNETEARQWRGFLTELEGTANTFPVYPEPVDQVTFGGTGNGIVSGAGQTGYSLNVSAGIAFNGITPLSKGMWATIVLPTKGHQLVMVQTCTAVGASTTGIFTMTFKPLLRESPANGASVILKTPYAQMASPDLEQGWNRDVMLTHGMKLRAEEVW